MYCVISDFNKNYYTPDCFPPADTEHPWTNQSSNTSSGSPNSSDVVTDMHHPCLKENSILFLLLMLGTVWFGITMFNFTKTYVAIVTDFSKIIQHVLMYSESRIRFLGKLLHVVF